MYVGIIQGLSALESRQIVMRIVLLCAFLIGLLILAFMSPNRATGATPQAPSAHAAERCIALATVDFSQTPDAATQIMDAHVVEASGALPAYCDVTGYVAPSTGFRLRLPSGTWNGKFIELGCGGACGSTDHIVGCDDVLHRGYVCIVSDNGHKSTILDVKWAKNNLQAQIDQGYRAAHVTALAGKAITKRYYGYDPKKSYFSGCSTGGVNALIEAERFPWDFDGIIAGAAAPSVTGIWIDALWFHRVLRNKSGELLLNGRDIDLLHKAVVAKCDLNDGIKDGLIGDPRTCNFHPSELQCAAEGKSACLTAEKVDAVKKIYGGPVTSRGKHIYIADALPGSEGSWLDEIDPADRSLHYMTDIFRYVLFDSSPPSSWTPADFDFDRDYKRLGGSEGILSPNNPDLRRFQNAGGKLLAYVGWSDFVARPMADYYEAAERVIGGRKVTQNFFRFFAVPGMGHCGGGDGASAIDYLSYLEAWVEKDRAPDKVIGSHVKTEDLMDKAMHGDQDALHALERRMEFPLDPATVEFSRPIYPYPIATRYLGRGNPKDAASFGPVQP
jgi:feruloyl esterase